MQVELVTYNDLDTQANTFKHLLGVNEYKAAGLNVYEDDNYLVLASSDKQLLYEGVIKIAKSSIVNRQTFQNQLSPSQIIETTQKQCLFQKMREIKKQKDEENKMPTAGTLASRRRDYFKKYNVDQEYFKQLYLDPSNTNEDVACLLNALPTTKGELDGRRISEMAAQLAISKKKFTKRRKMKGLPVDMSSINFNLILIDYLAAQGNKREISKLKKKYNLTDAQWKEVKSRLESR